ncbi:DUF6716 putative glycosyltransferase [Hansschlegelia plantiphila]|uniref:Uncharacterized protein n=1 Tax=Hansschlegelia plantiphila TaxID=374655 RepID=A0A9W6MVC8_9HYPH|nr:DUF6716 putative glycosyltransferase [Hansschlegelia plantiphila]GLK67828.1 hypothetical protein GCM10008179_14660 [Hansschlegelia plantiphila]
MTMETPEPKPSGRFAGRRVLALGTFDSFVKTAAAIGRLFEAEGASMRIAALAADAGQLSARQLRAGGVHESVPVLAAETLVSARLFRDAQIVIAVVDGGRARELFLAMAAADFSREPSRPIVVVASPGVVLADHLAGFMSRAPADILCFNTPADRALYEAAAAEIGVDATNAIVTGLLGLDRRPRPEPTGRPSIVFFEQPVIPSRRMQRTHLLSGLIDVAKRFPDADVLVKLRHARDERAHHAARFHLDDLARELFARGGRPANLSFTHEPAHELIERASVVATVSSTVAIEAMARGVPTRIVSDFGVSEILGTTYFVGSGCLAPIAALRPDLAAQVNPGWLAGSGAAAAPEALLSQCASLLDGQDRLEAALPLRALIPAYGSDAWLNFALGRGGAVALHAPHLAEKPRRLGFIAAVASRLRQARRFTPRG